MIRGILQVALVLGSSAIPDFAFAGATSSTLLGFTARSLSYTPAIRSEQDVTQSEEASDSVNGPTICQRVSAPVTLGIEVGSLGCFQNGGFWTFNHSVSMAMQVLYYPFESKGDISNDDSVKMANKSSGSLYLIGHTGFAKITHFQRSITNVTYSMDVLEVGGGAGYGYRLLKNTALGIEGTFMTGVVLSDATSGSANSFNVSTSLTIYL